MKTQVIETRYIPKSMRQQLELEITKTEYAAGRNNPVEFKVTPNVKKYRGDKDVTTLKRAVIDAQTGLSDCTYIVDIVHDETDSFRENAYMTDEEKRELDARRRNLMLFKTKTLREKLEEYIFEYTESLQEQPDKLDKSTDNRDYWFVSKTDPEMTEVIKIELGTSVPTVYSLTKEYYKQKYHSDNELTQEERDWATVLGWEGNVRSEIGWFMETYPTDEERLEFVNSMDKDHLGSTADTQVVICPTCHRPTFAAPAMQAYVDKQSKTVPYELPSQMRCEHCGADLTPCFAFDEGELINIERYVVTEDDLDNDED